MPTANERKAIPLGNVKCASRRPRQTSEEAMPINPMLRAAASDTASAVDHLRVHKVDFGAGRKYQPKGETHSEK